MPDEPGKIVETGEAAALSELPLCETLAQVAAWAARWSARATRADSAVVWTPDPVQPFLLSTGSWGEATASRARRAVARDEGVVRDLVRDRQPRLLSGAESPEAIAAPPAGPQPAWTLLVPAVVDGTLTGVVALAFNSRPRFDETLLELGPLLRHVRAALDRALRAERRIVGMRQAIERLTSLYDVSKAFGSTIEGDELAAIVARKAVDFAGAEAGSLWLLEGEADSVVLAATAINENYEIPDPPEAVGIEVVGDVVANQATIRRDSAAGTGISASPFRSLLAVALVEDERPIGALVVVNKRGRVSEFSAEDEDLLEDLARQAVRALRNARQFEAEKKVEELDALLAVSRQITATLDLDKVMQAIVNATAALIRYDRCAIAILDRGSLRLGAVSGMAKFDRKSADIRRTEELLQWVFFSGAEVNVRLQEDGTISADRPETEEKFRSFFAESGLKSFFGVLLQDEEGKLGVLGFECGEPIVFDDETRDLLQILVNQATVAVRNAQLYRQVPLAGFFKPLLERRQRLLAIPRRRRLAWGVGAIAVAAILFLVPWRLRVGGPARVLPGRRAAVTAGVDGIVATVMHREGDVIPAGEVIATLKDESYQAALAEAESARAVAESDAAKQRNSGNASALFEAESRLDELRARIAMEQQRFDFTRLRAPAAGVIVTPRLEERVGQSLARGAEFCVVADVGTVTVEVAVPENDSSLLKTGQPADVKLNPYPSRTFHGQVARVGARIREDGKDRFLIAEVNLANPDGALKTGMLGKARIGVGNRKISTILFRKPVRWLYGKLWPLLP